MPTVEFFVPCVPPKATGNDKRVMRFGDRTIISKNPKALEAETTWYGLFLPHKPSEPVPGPVALTVELTWPWRKNEPKKIRALGRVWHTSKPDLDNLQKTIQDVLSRSLFMQDDAQVSSLTMRKYWGDRPGVLVRIETLEGVR